MNGSRQAAPADLGRRVGAYLLDGLIGAVVTGVGWIVDVLLIGALARTGPADAGAVYLLLAPQLVPLLFATVWGVVVLALVVRRAATPGMMAVGVRVVDAETGANLRPAQAFARYLVLGLITGLTFGIGSLLLLIMAVQDRTGERRLWHDRAGGSLVIDASSRRPDASPSPPAQVPGVGRPGPAQAPAAQAGLPSAALTTVSLPPSMLQQPSDPVAAPDEAQRPPAAPPVMPPRAPTGPIARPPSRPVARPATGLIETVPGVSVPTASPPPAQEVGPPAVEGPDEDVTRFVGPRLTPQRPTPSWHLRLPDGSRRALQGAVLVGRNPQVRPGETPAQCLAIEDRELCVSKSHVLIDVTDAGPTATDRGSTNGTAVRRASGSVVHAVPGEPVLLADGDVIVLGDGPRLTVTTG